MKIDGVKIILSKWWPLLGQGHVLTSKLCFVKLVYDPSKKYIHLETTLEVVLHELRHAKQIKFLGIFNFYFTIINEYIRFGHKNSPLEIDARNGKHWPEYKEGPRMELMKWITLKGEKFY